MNPVRVPLVTLAYSSHNDSGVRVVTKYRYRYCLIHENTDVNHRVLPVLLLQLRMGSNLAFNKRSMGIQTFAAASAQLPAACSAISVIKYLSVYA